MEEQNNKLKTYLGKVGNGIKKKSQCKIHQWPQYRERI